MDIEHTNVSGISPQRAARALAWAAVIATLPVALLIGCTAPTSSTTTTTAPQEATDPAPPPLRETWDARR